MSRTVLLTGASGFIGAQVLQALADASMKVRLITRPGHTYPPNCTDCIEEVFETEDLFAETSSNLISACKGVDCIFHLAWYVEAGKYLTSDRNLDCLAGSVNLARAAVAAGVRRFVGAGTCFEYDTSQGHLSIDTPLKPASLYAAAKASLYEVLLHYLPAHDVEFLWCRFFYLYGEGEDPGRLVPYIRERVRAGEKAELTSGTQIRDFMEVSEAAKLFVNEGLGSRQNAVNICSGVSTTVRELAERIADEYGGRDLLEFGARPDNYTDPPCVVGIR